MGALDTCSFWQSVTPTAWYTAFTALQGTTSRRLVSFPDAPLMPRRKGETESRPICQLCSAECVSSRDF